MLDFVTSMLKATLNIPSFTYWRIVGVSAMLPRTFLKLAIIAYILHISSCQILPSYIRQCYYVFSFFYWIVPPKWAFSVKLCLLGVCARQTFEFLCFPISSQWLNVYLNSINQPHNNILFMSFVACFFDTSIYLVYIGFVFQNWEFELNRAKRHVSVGRFPLPTIVNHKTQMLSFFLLFTSMADFGTECPYRLLPCGPPCQPLRSCDVIATHRPASRVAILYSSWPCWRRINGTITPRGSLKLLENRTGDVSSPIFLTYSGPAYNKIPSSARAPASLAWRHWLGPRPAERNQWPLRREYPSAQECSSNVLEITNQTAEMHDKAEMYEICEIYMLQVASKVIVGCRHIVW